MAWITLLLAAGCGDDGTLADVASIESALSSCNSPTDCTRPSGAGTCVKMACVMHRCEFAMDATACPTGCGLATPLTDCGLGLGGCIIVPCKAGATASDPNFCDFNDYTTSSSCGCKVAGDCSAANTCQAAAVCTSGTCTYTAKTDPAVHPCCNVTADCGGAATCTNNTCDCGAGKKFCGALTLGNGRCVPSGGCCAPTDCTAGNACQARTCSLAGACGFVSTGAAGCCNAPGDCATHANATAACTANTCVYTCDSGFHDCSGTCSSNTSTASCGAMCSACPAGNVCQMPACSFNTCGFAAAGPSPCCNTVGDCTAMNACQNATACTNNQCVFSAAAGTGCCDSATDCALPADPCLERTCVANQCATAPVAGCTAPDDLGAPDDLSAAPDLAGKLSLTGGGGCSVAGPAAPRAATPLALVVVVAFALFFARRRRHA